MLGVTLKKNKFLLVRHDDWEFYQISKMDLYHRVFSDSLGNAIRFEKNCVKVRFNCEKVYIFRY